VTVDGAEVEITVISTWVNEPSRLPLLLGAAIGGALIAMGVALVRMGRTGSVLLIPTALLALAVGWLQYGSLPAETGPRLVWWALPAVAVVAAVAAVALTRRDRVLASGAALVAGAQLAIWGWVKRDGLTAAIVPTDAPGWLDRATTVLAVVVGVGAVGVALWELFGSSTRREPNAAA
jgi:hypothetical protein